MTRKRTDIVKLQLRLPEAVRRNLSQAARDQKPSLNAEILHRLNELFLRGNLAALMREHINNTAIKVAEQVVQKFGQQNRGNDNDKAS